MVSGSMLANVGCQHDHPGDVGGGYMHEISRCSGQTLQIVLKGIWVTILGCFHFSGEGEKKKTQDLGVGGWVIAGENVSSTSPLTVQHGGMHPMNLLHG